MPIPQEDIRALCEEKYGGDLSAPMDADIARLAQGEPLAYVIGTQPFLGLSISLDSRPLIPRPETEWWTEEAVCHIGTRPLKVLDLCAGSGAIGCAVLRHCPNAQVTFVELNKQHQETIKKNISLNALDASRATIFIGDLFTPVQHQTFDVILTNPPYIPRARTLPVSVTQYEPSEALFADSDGLSVISRIAKEVGQHLSSQGEVWVECDIEHIKKAEELFREQGATRTEIRTDPYGRERLLVAYY